MRLTLQAAAKILSMTEDEVMFLHQKNELQAKVNDDTFAWEFELNEVLEKKEQLEKEAADEAKAKEEANEREDG